jgi:hypothetical protein
MGEFNPYQSPQADEPLAATFLQPPTAEERRIALARCRRWLFYSGVGVVIGAVTATAMVVYRVEFLRGRYDEFQGAGLGGLAGMALGGLFELVVRRRAKAA